MSAVWQLDANSALLTHPAWNATLDLTRPDRGLQLQLSGAASFQQLGANANRPLLQILGAAFGQRQPWQSNPVDAYVRGNDLVAIYDNVLPQNLCAQIYWSHLQPDQFAPDFTYQVLTVFDLIFSLNTRLLDSDPQSNIRCEILHRCRLFHLQHDESENFSAKAIEPSSIARDNPWLTVTPSHAPGQHNTGCFIARFDRMPYSYIEMVHPADFCRSTLSSSPHTQLSPASEIAATQIEHHLFQQRLEKGVILRARVRCALVNQQNDEAVAIAAYQQFAAAEPPLTV